MGVTHNEENSPGFLKILGYLHMKHIFFIQYVSFFSNYTLKTGKTNLHDPFFAQPDFPFLVKAFLRTIHRYILAEE